MKPSSPLLLQMTLWTSWILIPSVHCGSVLMYMPFSSKSIKITYMPIAEKMAERGHEVVVILPYATKNGNPKIREILVNVTEFERLQGEMSRHQLSAGRYKVPFFRAMMGMALDMQDQALGHPEVHEMLREKKKFDVCLVNIFFMGEGGLYLAKKFEANTVLYFSGQSSMSSIDEAVGQPHMPSHLPFPLFGFGTNMNFFQRVLNFIATHVFHHVVRKWYLLGKVDDLLDKRFPDEERPSLLEMERNASATFTFGHPLLLDGWRPTSPNFVPLGMMNCRKARRANFEGDDGKRLLKFLDDAKDGGVVYVSFGSVLRASEMSDEKRDMLLEVFGSLNNANTKVVWKWETDAKKGMPLLPPNVMLHKWLPQQDVLGHPNVKLFVSHGGQSSFQETLCHRKPAVFVPVVGDQFANAQAAERMGFAVNLPFVDASVQTLTEAIADVLHDPKCGETARQLGSALMDQKEHPLDRAIWWLEHIMRHPTLYPGKSPVHNLTFYQYFCFDVILFLALGFTAIPFLLYKIFSICCFYCNLTTRKSKRD